MAVDFAPQERGMVIGLGGETWKALVQGRARIRIGGTVQMQYTWVKCTA
jgi:hypothetical protein